MNDCTSSGSVGDMLFFTPLNYCYIVDNGRDYGIRSEIVTDCGNGKRTINRYSDYTCGIKVSSGSNALDQCHDYGSTVIETDVCV